jgi:hypothetical protein
MDADLGKLLEGSDEYIFNPGRLDAVPVTGTLRKSSEPGKCILLVSSSPGGDLAVEVNVDDVGFHEKPGACGGCENESDRITLYLRPGAVVTTSFRGTAARAVGTSAFLASPIGEILPAAGPLHSPRRAETSRRLGNCASARAALKPLAGRPYQCITDGYIACGERPGAQRSAGAACGAFRPPTEGRSI